MNGFVKLRRGLADHVRSRRMTLVEHGAYTLLLQLADHSTGSWRGTQRSFAAAAAISSGLAWKILTSLEAKGYLRWNREKRVVEICKYFEEKPAENPVRKPVEIRAACRTPGHNRDQLGHVRDRYIRNTRTPLEKEEIAHASERLSEPPSSPVLENHRQNQTRPASVDAAGNHAPPPSEPAKGSTPGATPPPAVLAEILQQLGRLAVAKSLIAGADHADSWSRRKASAKGRVPINRRRDRWPP